MNYGTYTEYKIKNWVFENFGFFNILQKYYRNYKKIRIVWNSPQQFKNIKIMNYGTCRECKITIWVFEHFGFVKCSKIQNRQ